MRLYRNEKGFDSLGKQTSKAVADAGGKFSVRYTKAMNYLEYSALPRGSVILDSEDTGSEWQKGWQGGYDEAARAIAFADQWSHPRGGLIVANADTNVGGYAGGPKSKRPGEVVTCTEYFMGHLQACKDAAYRQVCYGGSWLLSDVRNVLGPNACIWWVAGALDWSYVIEAGRKIWQIPSWVHMWQQGQVVLNNGTLADINTVLQPFDTTKETEMFYVRKSDGDIYEVDGEGKIHIEPGTWAVLEAMGATFTNLPDSLIDACADRPVNQSGVKRFVQHVTFEGELYS